MFHGSIVDPRKAYAYSDVFSDSIKLAIVYPETVSVRTIGFSARKRGLLLVTLGKGEKKVLLAGAHHGREYISAALLMKMAEEYAWHEQNNAAAEGWDVRKLLGETSLHIVPMVNPDGVEIALNGWDEPVPPQFKGVDFRTWKANANGVDLNRQYPCCWEELISPAKPGPEGYKGKSPAAEPEVKAVMKLCSENAYSLAASFHTKGEEIYYADSLTHGRLPRAKRIAQKLLMASGYALAPVSSDPSVFGGGMENWFRYAFGRCAFLIELAPYDNSPLPVNDAKFESLVWNKAWTMGLVLANEALDI